MLKDPKLVQLNKALYKWFTARHSEGKPMIWCVIIEKAKSNEMKICSLRAVTKNYL
jgi:hypothetical protein